MAKPASRPSMGATWHARQPKCRDLLRELDPDGTLAASGRVGLITFKDCKPAMREALGIPAERTGHFWEMRGSNALEKCDILLIVGTPMLRTEDVARLARAYYHADQELIDETSVRGEDRRWRYRDPRMRAEWPMHSPVPSSRESAHRNRPLRYDGRVVVTLCADEVLYLPVTTEITSLPQLTPEGLPLALARRAAEDKRLTKAAAELKERGEAVTSRALAEATHISLKHACAWLRQRETGAPESETMLSTLQYNSYSTSDNMPAAENSAESETPESAPAAVDRPEASPAPPDGEPLVPALRLVCPAASHRLLWRWNAGAWQCPACGT